MKLQINGEERAFSESALTLAALIESLQMKPDRVAVELNRDIVQRDRWPETPLKDGDRLEIVHFVGGGCHPIYRGNDAATFNDDVSPCVDPAGAGYPIACSAGAPNSSGCR
jgi:thiamine biosynthesis protein ThiS